MGLFKRKPKVLTPQQAEEIYTKDFFDMIPVSYTHLILKQVSRFHMQAQAFRFTIQRVSL